MAKFNQLCHCYLNLLLSFMLIGERLRLTYRYFLLLKCYWNVFFWGGGRKCVFKQLFFLNKIWIRVVWNILSSSIEKKTGITGFSLNIKEESYNLLLIMCFRKSRLLTKIVNQLCEIKRFKVFYAMRSENKLNSQGAFPWKLTN